ncbi:UTRA domain-containing protein [Micromonospora orduensis]|uniref:UTRA domain-containing protein n=1 Tax=Micromonospora orduensis TaxID=1420891 RepID=UPI001ABF18D7|nr:UTRA domain-containing protein [Micromonospora orduensis]
MIRSSERHQVEKDLAVRPEAERAVVGEAETNLNMQISEQEFRSRYDQVEAGADLADLFRIEPTDLVLRRRYDSTDRGTGLLLSSSVSYMPVALVSSNPALLDEANEPWPGGTQHQLSTVGAEIMTIIDEVTARMPTTAEAQLWGLPDGVPLILCRRISLDANEKVVEVSDAEYPADRTELRFVTPLKPWPKRRSNGGKTSGRQGGRP